MRSTVFPPCVPERFWDSKRGRKVEKWGTVYVYLYVGGHPWKRQKLNCAIEKISTDLFSTSPPGSPPQWIILIRININKCYKHISESNANLLVNVPSCNYYSVRIMLIHAYCKSKTRRLLNKFIYKLFLCRCKLYILELIELLEHRVVKFNGRLLCW